MNKHLCCKKHHWHTGSSRCLLISALLFVSAPAAFAANQPVEDAIALGKSLQASQDAVQSKHAEIDSIEQLLNSYKEQIAAIEKRQQVLKARLATLGETQSSSTAKLDAKTRAIARETDVLHAQLRALYKTTRSAFTKPLLAQLNPSERRRFLHYQQQLVHAQAQRLQSERGDLVSTNEALSKTSGSKNEIKEEQAALDERVAELKALVQRRSTLLQTIQARLSGEKTQLADLESDRDNLQSAADELTAHENTPPAPTTPVGTGEWPWPVDGKIIAQFDQAKGTGDATWSGLLVETTAQAPVIAVHDGEVVFAEWMQGFGLLLIVDHGDNTMSLYGNNHVLNFEVGNTVLVGDELATTGNSGIANTTGLYFEVRQNGGPVDPLSLLREDRSLAKR